MLPRYGEGPDLNTPCSQYSESAVYTTTNRPSLVGICSHNLYDRGAIQDTVSERKPLSGVIKVDLGIGSHVLLKEPMWALHMHVR